MTLHLESLNNPEWKTRLDRIQVIQMNTSSRHLALRMIGPREKSIVCDLKPSDNPSECAVVEFSSKDGAYIEDIVDEYRALANHLMFEHVFAFLLDCRLESYRSRGSGQWCYQVMYSLFRRPEMPFIRRIPDGDPTGSLVYALRKRGWHVNVSHVEIVPAPNPDTEYDRQTYLETFYAIERKVQDYDALEDTGDWPEEVDMSSDTDSDIEVSTEWSEGRLEQENEERDLEDEIEPAL